MNRRLLLLAPLGVAAAAGAGFLAMLHGMEAGSFDPRAVPSPLLGRHVPRFALPGLGDGGRPGAGTGTGLSDADLASGRPLLVNFFASWCAPCVQEAPALLGLRRSGVTLVGIAWKDRPEDTRRFLAEHGDPYARVGSDQPGLAAIDFGLTGVPETYLVDPSGVIRWHFANALTTDVIDAQVTPLLRRYA